jgi:alanine dehydrogenase
MRLQNNLGRKVFTSVIKPNVLMNELKTADVAVGAVHSEEGRTPVYVTEDMVSHMKAGSIILDVSIDQGGVFETSEVTSHDNPTFKKYDVIHYCVPNIPSRVARTASQAISNILSPILIEASDAGGLEKLLWYSEGLRHGVYIYKGHLTNQHLSERFDIKFTDLNLLFAANI